MYLKKNYTISISYTDWQTAKFINNNEVLVNRRFIDIQHIEFTPNKVLIHGHYDQEEDLVHGLIGKNHDHKKISSIQNIFFFLFYEDIYANAITNIHVLGTPKLGLYNRNLTNPILNTFEPPPKFFINDLHAHC